MAPTDGEWTPQFVSPPVRNPEGRTYFDWKDKELQKWEEDAIRMQEGHVQDNNRTEWFTYKSEDRDALELRILVTIYGIRTPQDGNKAAPSCPLRTYNRNERLHARQLKKVIIKHSDIPENIRLNVIYTSMATKAEDDKKFYLSQEPVFVINDRRQFIDKDGRVYANFQDYKENNKLPKAAILAPKNGTYTPANTSDGRVPLELDETPSTGLLKRIKDVTDTVVMVGGIVLSVTGVVTFLSPALFSARAMSVIQTGSFILSGYSLYGAATGIYDKTLHDESILLILISAGLSSYTDYLRTQAIKYARQGKTYAEVMEKISKAHRTMFAVTNVFTILSSSSALISSIFDLMAKRERTWYDYYQLSMGLFMLVNVCTKPKTIKGVFESEQMQYLSQMKKSLESDEAKEEMSKMLREHSTSDKKAYMIRNLNKIENRTEFFELIGKTISSVTCTADGLAINDKIDIAPEAYNDIGKAVFTEKLNQIGKARDGFLHDKVMKEFDKYISRDTREEFEAELKKIENLPREKQEEAVKKLVSRFGTAGGPTQEQFNDSWKTVKTACEEKFNENVKNMIGNLKKGSTGDAARDTIKEDDFKELEELAKKQLHGTITPEEQEKLQKQLERCSSHRKEYFFKSSADYRNDANNEAFKRDINTFTNAQNERLCYRINIEDVKLKLRDIYGVPNHEDITVNDQKPFTNMKIGDYDRLSRVLKDYGERGTLLFTAAEKIGNDPNFIGKVKTPYDMTSVTKRKQ
ncbi:unnamed protein product [Didymodactylos carnosus]|uniref:DUF4781 domain-containing protein n=1 Tax=Didymodactylos carnosus TaxID=1234261 RepID=A0A815I1C5_9BILA|nr:unnamed protein product [Didymodactylos carnosus]CAF1359054.1 unnamed protein product [Didymodactylos carnosus]CAF4069680.1 unnamed protein product [Didymodactylos carnosus]CAF4235913.1 unnamed protein product [Didymodactylos carnosus]